MFALVFIIACFIQLLSVDNLIDFFAPNDLIGLFIDICIIIIIINLIMLHDCEKNPEKIAKDDIHEVKAIFQSWYYGYDRYMKDPTFNYISEKSDFIWKYGNKRFSINPNSMYDTITVSTIIGYAESQWRKNHFKN